MVLYYQEKLEEDTGVGEYFTEGCSQSALLNQQQEDLPGHQPDRSSVDHGSQRTTENPEM